MNKPALVIIDVQMDFLPGGALPAPEGDKIVPVLRDYARRFTGAGLPVIATRDWHPPVTRHFKDYGGLWQPHCVQGTRGADFATGLDLPDGTLVISAGIGPEDEGYTSFEGYDAEGRPFDEALREQGIDHLYIGGIATDYCVRMTVLDALRRGYRVTLLLDGISGIDVQAGDSDRAIDEMKAAGAAVATLETVDIGMAKTGG